MERRYVRIQRWPSDGPVVGPSLIVAPLEEVAEKLVDSGFMRGWFVEQVKGHLLSGGLFLNRGMERQDLEQPIVPNGEQVFVRAKSEYRLATQEEFLSYCDSAEYASRIGRQVSKRSQENAYSLHYHEGAKIIAAYDRLPPQAKTVLDILNEGGRDTYTEASIGVLLHDNVGRLRTKQNAMSIFKFYRSRFLDEGHLEEVGNAGAAGDGEE